MRAAGLFSMGILFIAAANKELADYRTAVDAHRGNAVVLLVQDGCAPCRRLENDLVPILRQGGMLEDSTITILSVQKHSQAVRQLQGGAINQRRGFPVLVVFRQKPGGQRAWRAFGYSGQGVLVKWLRDIGRWQPPVSTRRGIL